jgi:hypothetical protein
MKTKMLIMRPDQPHETREIEFPEPFGPSYGLLKGIVEDIVGHPMEHVTVLADFSGGLQFKRADMFVNEMGHLSIPPLPRNEAATILYRRNALLYQGYNDPEDLPWIAGPAVLFRDIVWR